MENIQNFLAQMPKSVGIMFVMAMLMLYISPSILAYIFNRNQFRKIAAVNIVAGLSWPAWVATLMWAVSGRVNGQVDGFLRRPATRWFWPVLIAVLIAIPLMIHGVG